MCVCVPSLVPRHKMNGVVGGVWEEGESEVVDS